MCSAEHKQTKQDSSKTFGLAGNDFKPVGEKDSNVLDALLVLAVSTDDSFSLQHTSIQTTPV